MKPFQQKNIGEVPLKVFEDLAEKHECYFCVTCGFMVQTYMNIYYSHSAINKTISCCNNPDYWKWCAKIWKENGKQPKK